MRVNLDFEQVIHEIEFEEFMGKNINKYHKEFISWYYEKMPCKEGGTVFIQRKSLTYKYFDYQPILDWLNEKCPSCNAHIVRKNIVPGEEDKSLPYMCF